MLLGMLPKLRTRTYVHVRVKKNAMVRSRLRWVLFFEPKKGLDLLRMLLLNCWHGADGRIILYHASCTSTTVRSRPWIGYDDERLKACH